MSIHVRKTDAGPSFRRTVDGFFSRKLLFLLIFNYGMLVASIEERDVPFNSHKQEVP
jgi:hypothetical protein